MPSLGDVVDLVHSWYPPHTADAWDAVGLVLGDPEDAVTKVMFAVDPTLEVASEAVAWGADLLVVHHPLYLKGVSSVAATTPKGRTLQTLARGGCALLAAHTNADQALSGVSESMALALGLSELTPIIPAPSAPADKLTTFVPTAHADEVRAALAAAGAGAVGDYERCSFTGQGQGRFTPKQGASPSIGEIDVPETVDEERIEVLLPRGRRSAVVRALLAAHPYEEPAWDVVETADANLAGTGTGRVGAVEPTTLREFAASVAAALPATAGGVRVGGDPDRPIRRVALCGGAGDFLLDRLAGSDVDVYVTSDLRHHTAGEFLEKGGPALIDVAHWAAEWTWLPAVEARLRTHLGATVETRVSTLRTDPWTMLVTAPCDDI